MPPLLLPLTALIAGILASPYLDPAAVAVTLPVALLVAAARPRCIPLFIGLLGAWLPSLEPEVPPDPPAEAARLTATLLRPPEWRGLGVYLDVQVLTLDGRPYRGRARLSEFLDDADVRRIFDALDLRRGDTLEILVRLQRPAVYRNPGVFDFRRYLERQGVYWTGTIRNPRLIAVQSRGWAVWSAGDRVGAWVERRIESYFPADPDSRALVLGMVLGQKHQLTAEMERRFQEGGLYHLVVVSGFNLAVIAGAAGLASRLLLRHRGSRLAATAAAVLAYAVLVGPQAPVIRAAIMAGILLACKALDRTYSALNALCLAAFAILLADPSSIEDSSFLMTFAAVGALVVLGVPAVRWALSDLKQELHDFQNTEADGWLPPEAADWRVSRRLWCELHGLPFWVATFPWRLGVGAAEALILSLSVESVFAGFMIESFHRVAPYSPLLNVPAGLLAAAITPLGLLLIPLPGILAWPVAWTVQGLIRALLGLLGGALALPGAAVRVPSAPIWIWALYGIALMTAAVSLRRRLRLPAALAVASIAVLQIAMVKGDFSPGPPEEATVTVLDVGQGDSILVELPDRAKVLIDGGGLAAGRFLNLQDRSTFSIGEDVVSAYLFGRGIRHLDAVVLTHAHNDHLDGLSDILANFRVDELWVGRNPMIPAYRELIDDAQNRGVAVRSLSEGDRAGLFTVLHPPRHWRVRKSAENNDSLVLLLDTGHRTALFTGDLEQPLAQPTSVDLLKVPHHGSKGARLRTRSAIRVISVGGDNPFGHPHPSALPALRTDRLGAVEIVLGRGKLSVRFPGLE